MGDASWIPAMGMCSDRPHLQHRAPCNSPRQQTAVAIAQRRAHRGSWSQSDFSFGKTGKGGVIAKGRSLQPLQTLVNCASIAVGTIDQPNGTARAVLAPPVTLAFPLGLPPDPARPAGREGCGVYSLHHYARHIQLRKGTTSHNLLCTGQAPSPACRCLGVCSRPAPAARHSPQTPPVTHQAAHHGTAGCGRS